MDVNKFGRHYYCRRSKGLFKLITQGDFDINMKHIRRVRDGIELNDAVTLSMLDKKIQELKKNIIEQVKLETGT